MHPRTIATIDKLNGVEWFSRVGITDMRDATVLTSWDDAIKACSDSEWETLCLEATNQYRARIAESSQSQLEDWNHVVDSIKPSVEALVERKTRSVVLVENLPKVFVDTVLWDILHICMESEFADSYPPGFYASQAYWYFKGHFPCGWEGNFPDGRIVVY